MRDQVREEVSFTDGKVIVQGQLHTRGKIKRADYILYYKPSQPLAIIEAKDTANVAKEIKNNNIENMAAIASLEASKLYDLSVIKKNIQNNKNNETRFVIVSKKIVSSQIKCDKASLKLVLSHKTGSLAKILNILSNTFKLYIDFINIYIF